MSDSARVASIEALRRLRGAVIRFSDEGRGAINETESTLQRTILWLRNEQIPHWTKEGRVRAEEVVRAKSLVRRKETASFREGAHAVEERIALAQAEARLAHARERLDKCNAWGRRLDQVADRFSGRVERLSGQLDAELPNAAARLGRMIESVESYVQVAPDAGDASTGDAGSTTGMSRGGASGVLSGASGSRLPWCRELRAMVLRRADRAALLDATEVAGSAWQDPSVELLQDALAREVREMPEPVRAQERLCIEAGVDPTGGGAFVRVPSVEGAEDSGWVWFAWPRVPGTGAGERSWEVRDAASVAGSIPEVARAFALPAGYVVLVDRGQIVTVIDHNDTLCVGTVVDGSDQTTDGGT